MISRQATERMWRALESEHTVPDPQDLGPLSGLMGADLERFVRVWSVLATDIRQRLSSALRALAEADFEMDFSAIFRLALDDADPQVRVTAIEGLREVEDVRLVPQLARILSEDAASEVRAAAARALGVFVLLGELEKIRPRPFNAAVAALTQTFLDTEEHNEVRQRAIESLGFSSSAEVADMIDAAYAHPNEHMRTSAVFAMGRSADKRWAGIVLRELSNPAPEMRLEATRACGELQLREAVRDLVSLVDDVDPNIQRTALWALGQIGGAQARRTLQRYIEDRDDALSNTAQEALDELEFFYGDLASFFGSPADFDGADEDQDDEHDWRTLLFDEESGEFVEAALDDEEFDVEDDLDDLLNMEDTLDEDHSDDDADDAQW